MLSWAVLALYLLAVLHLLVQSPMVARGGSADDRQMTSESEVIQFDEVMEHGW